MQSQPKVLLIEDDEDDAEYLRELLAKDSQHKFQVESVSRLSQAIPRIETESYDIVLADLSLPDSSGLETFEQVQTCSENNVPVLVLTGLSDDQTALEALRHGAQDYLVKGKFSGPLLIKSILYAIERNKLHRALAHTTKELSQTNERLNQLAQKDALTDLFNRRGFQQVLSREAAWAKRNGSSLMVLIVDLDDFKKINDTYSHSVGDSVLKEIAARIQRPLRATDFAARIGGDEFLILLPDTEPAEGVGIAEKVRHEVSERPFKFNSNLLNVTASVGVIPFHGHASIDELLSQTHGALYKSKRLGKNRVSFDQRRDPNESLKTVLEELKKDNTRVSVMQPIFNLVENKICAYELLNRVGGVDLETNPPPELDRECLKTSLRKAESIPREFCRHINISPNTIMNTPIRDLLSLFVGGSGENFCLEISQHQIVGDPYYLVQPLLALKKAGFLIAIENVSFGQNSLESSILLEPHYLKMDKQYVIGIEKDQFRLRSLNRLLKMAESLGMKVIAHGIESPGDLRVLKSAGIKYGEGFYLGEPKPNYDSGAIFHEKMSKKTLGPV